MKSKYLTLFIYDIVRQNNVLVQNMNSIFEMGGHLHIKNPINFNFLFLSFIYLFFSNTNTYFQSILGSKQPGQSYNFCVFFFFLKYS